MMADMAGSEPSTQPCQGAKDGPTVVGDKQTPCLFRFFGVFVRIWGIISVAALSTAAWWLMSQRIDYPYTSWYTMSSAIAIGFLEMIWFINSCVFCRDEGGVCCTCWRLFVWIDYWRKTILYVLLAVPEFVIDRPALVPFVCGAIIILLAVLYLFKTCETCCSGNDERSSKRRSRSIQPSSQSKDTTKDVEDNSALMKEQQQQQQQPQE